MGLRIPWDENIKGAKKCPICGTVAGKSYEYCKGCGAELPSNEYDTRPHPNFPSIPKETETSALSEYPRISDITRQFSLRKRITKALSSPADAMKDIVLAPDYSGPLVILACNLLIGVLAIQAAFQKIDFVGISPQTVQAALNFSIFSLLVFGPFILVLRWLVKSLLVYYFCSNESSWEFKTAASVTGYAYAPSLVLGVVSLVLFWAVAPTIVISSTHLGYHSLNLFVANPQLLRYVLIVALPIWILRIIWSSYVGSLGANKGTRSLCSRDKGFFIFLVLALVGSIIDYLL